ncbi:FHA domain-containing protein [Pseudarthrobacter enclensis]|uniref:FHA domain-containing protein n=1 Tax=Pseudarthrobacter enclensis TaxID=993070 RepID=UPI00342EE599
MTGTSYVPGDWLGIVRSRTAVVLGPDTAPGLSEEVWNLLAGKPEVYEVLQAITGSAGGDLSRIPPFAILDFTGPLRVFLRGTLELSVDTPDGTVDLDGRDVTTWSERSFAAPGAGTLSIPGAGTGSRLPLRLAEGMVLLQSLHLGADLGHGALEAPAAGAGAAATVGGVPGEREPADSVPDEGGTDHDGPDGTASAADMPAGEVQADAPAAAEPVAAVAVDSSGVAEVGPDQPSEATIAPGPAEVSVETVYAVLDEDGEYLDGTPPGSNDAGAGRPGTGSATGADTPDAADGGASDSDLADSTACDSTASEPGAPAPGIDGQEPAGSRAAGIGTHSTGVPAADVPGEADAAPAIDQTSSYDHLWERTVMRNIEDAAVREDPEDLQQEAPALAAPAPQAALEAADAVAAPDHHAADGMPADQEADAEPAPEDVRPATGLLIESVPWRTGGGAGTPEPPAPFTPSPPPFTAAPAPVSPPQAPGAASPALPPATPAAFDDDHDGQTVMKSSVAGAGGQGAPAAGPGAAPQANPAAGPLVLARVCPQGHANPPIRSACTACGAPLPQDAVQVARPRLGRMRLSTGELLDLDQSLVIGRQPSVSRVQGGVMPRLVQVPSPGGDISRSHVEVRLEGWHVMLCDLKATNGTVLVREGQPPRRLAQNEMAILLDGDIAELGDKISLRFEEIP